MALDADPGHGYLKPKYLSVNKYPRGSFRLCFEIPIIRQSLRVHASLGYMGHNACPYTMRRERVKHDISVELSACYRS